LRKREGFRRLLARASEQPPSVTSGFRPFAKRATLSDPDALRVRPLDDSIRLEFVVVVKDDLQTGCHSGTESFYLPQRSARVQADATRLVGVLPVGEKPR
jgi:hypothetical protein